MACCFSIEKPNNIFCHLILLLETRTCKPENTEEKLKRLNICFDQCSLLEKVVIEPKYGKSIYERIIIKKSTCEEMVFCYQNCSDLLWEKLFYLSRKTFEIRGWRPRICKSFEITRTIYSHSERSEQFLVTECFFNLFLEVSQI